MRARLYQHSLILCVLLVSASDVALAQATQVKRSGTWAASNGGGQTFIGTWTAIPDSTGKTVTGTWTLGDPRNPPSMNGAWSAAKAATRWNGAWRAVAAGKTQEYSGTWASGVDLNGSATFAELFEKAVGAALSGTWQMGPQSGAWSIRAAKRDSTP